MPSKRKVAANIGTTKSRRVILRTRIGTGQKLPKDKLVRLVRTGKKPDYQVMVDATGKTAGRGASLQANVVVLDLAFKKQAIERALKLERRLNSEEIAKIKQEFLKQIA